MYQHPTRPLHTRQRYALDTQYKTLSLSLDTSHTGRRRGGRLTPAPVAVSVTTVTRPVVHTRSTSHTGRRRGGCKTEFARARAHKELLRARAAGTCAACRFAHILAHQRAREVDLFVCMRVYVRPTSKVCFSRQTRCVCVTARCGRSTSQSPSATCPGTRSASTRWRSASVTTVARPVVHRRSTMLPTPGWNLVTSDVALVTCRSASAKAVQTCVWAWLSVHAQGLQ